MQFRRIRLCSKVPPSARQERQASSVQKSTAFTHTRCSVPSELSTHAQTRQQLMLQVSETEMVKQVGSTVRLPVTSCKICCSNLTMCAPTCTLQELELLDDDATVFKLIGPAMIKQDLVEAKTNVSKRLEYIQGEMRRITERITSAENKVRDQQALVSSWTSTQNNSIQQQRWLQLPALHGCDIKLCYDSVAITSLCSTMTQVVLCRDVRGVACKVLSCVRP